MDRLIAAFYTEGGGQRSASPARQAAADVMRQQEAARFMKKYGMPQGRALTDLTGPFYTLVWETEYPNLAAWESAMNDPRGAEDFRAWYRR